MRVALGTGSERSPEPGCSFRPGTKASSSQVSLDPVPLYGVYARAMGSADRTLTIGKLATAAGVGVETIRFYERQGLLPAPPRKRSGYRQYPTDAVARVLFIRRAKDLGFTLREISELLDLRVAPGANCTNIRKRAMSKLDDIDAKMAELVRMQRALQRLVKACRGRGPRGDCPILEALETEDNDARD